LRLILSTNWQTTFSISTWPSHVSQPQSGVAYEVQKQVLSEGIGYSYVKADIEQHNGGTGRNYVYYQEPLNIRGVIEKGQAFTETTVDCGTLYTVYSLVLGRTAKTNDVNAANINGYSDVSRLLIPTADTATIASWDLALAALDTRLA